MQTTLNIRTHRIQKFLAVAVMLVSAGAFAQSGPGSAPTLHIGFFGNVDYLTKSEEAGKKSGFRNGTLDLYLNGQISDHWSAVVELNFEHIGTDLERYQLNYEYSDAFRLAVGRVHNPLVRWNVDQHHGLYMQTPIDRPSMANWEDTPGLWPVHFVGVMASGQFQTALSPRYYAGVGNGRGQVLDEVQTSSDRNNSKAIVLSFGIAPAAVRGLEVYVSGYSDDIPALSGPIKEKIGTLSASYLTHNVEVRSEWSRMVHRRSSFGTQRTTGSYIVGSTPLPGRWKAVKPYVMLDRLDTAAGDDFLEGVPSRNSWIGGFRWDMEKWIALKADYRSDRIGSAGRRGTVRVQLAFSLGGDM